MKTAIRFYSYTRAAQHAQTMLALGVCPYSCLVYISRLSTEREPVARKATVQDKRIHNARMQASKADARCARINARRPGRVAKIMARLEYVKQGICPFSFEAYQRGIPVRGFYALARGEQKSLSARFPWGPLNEAAKKAEYQAHLVRANKELENY